MIHFPGILDHGKDRKVDNPRRNLLYDDNLTDDKEFDVFWQAVIYVQDTRYSALDFCGKAIVTIPVTNADCENFLGGGPSKICSAQSTDFLFSSKHMRLSDKASGES